MTKQSRASFEDDGRTIADMNVEGFRWYRSKELNMKREALLAENLTRRERRAIIWGSMKAYMPVFLVILAGYVIVYLLFLIWVASLH